MIIQCSMYDCAAPSEVLEIRAVSVSGSGAWSRVGENPICTALVAQDRSQDTSFGYLHRILRYLHRSNMINMVFECFRLTFQVFHPDEPLSATATMSQKEPAAPELVYATARALTFSFAGVEARLCVQCDSYILKFEVCLVFSNPKLGWANHRLRSSPSRRHWQNLAS